MIKATCCQKKKKQIFHSAEKYKKTHFGLTFQLLFFFPVFFYGVAAFPKKKKRG
jgi:hypothetical protein